MSANLSKKEEVAMGLRGFCQSGVAKWVAVVEDSVIPMPRRQVTAGVIKYQAEVPAEFVLVRDHNSPDDVVFQDADTVDLAAGNVFYRLPKSEVHSRGACNAPAKLAFVVDDRPEVVIRADQTGKSLRLLFGLPLHAHLVRDLEGGDDQVIGLEDSVQFTEGPAFYTRDVVAELRITVNSRVFTEHDGVRPEMTGLEIAALVYPEKPTDTRVWLISEGNREIGLADRINIHCGEVFDVTRQNVSGGYESSRVERELGQLRSGGTFVTLVDKPVPVVVYHDLRTHPGYGVPTTDILVPIPSAYPGQHIDWAYLPESSPLLGHVKGNPQGHQIQALGRSWQQISYHPHQGGGGPAWNPAIHGFHTYLGELLSWLYDAK